jgi:hypothetical protein
MIAEARAALAEARAAMAAPPVAPPADTVIRDIDDDVPCRFECAGTSGFWPRPSRP